MDHEERINLLVEALKETRYLIADRTRPRWEAEEKRIRSLVEAAIDNAPNAAGNLQSVRDAAAWDRWLKEYGHLPGCPHTGVFCLSDEDSFDCCTCLEGSCYVKVRDERVRAEQHSLIATLSAALNRHVLAYRPTPDSRAVKCGCPTCVVAIERWEEDAHLLNDPQVRYAVDHAPIKRPA